MGPQTRAAFARLAGPGAARISIIRQQYLDCPKCGHRDVTISNGKFTRHATFCALDAPKCDMSGKAI